MKQKAEVDGKEVELNEWIADENTGAKVMYSRLQTISVCRMHRFDKDHRCTRCPYIFVGFKSNLHIQKDDGIYNRQSGNKIV